MNPGRPQVRGIYDNEASADRCLGIDRARQPDGLWIIAALRTHEKALLDG